MQDYSSGDAIFFIEGKVLSMNSFDNIYAEIEIKDDLSEMVFPIITFNILQELFVPNAKILSIGAIHIDWIPDLRFKSKHYDYALKADLIRIRN